MKRETSGTELQSLLEAIKASDVVESRVQLITELGELDIPEESDLASLLESLIIFWEDFTCLDVSQCVLNKTILHVAAKYLESNISRCLGQFLALGTKASIWCRKHLKMTLMSTEDSQEEEHCSLFFQLLLDLLSYSAASFSALGRYPVSCDKELMVFVENFILEQLNLTKDSISEKRIYAFSSEVLKVAHMVLDAVIRLCRVYCDGVKWDFYDARSEQDRNSTDCEKADSASHVINITRCTIEKLCEVGVVAANDGGSLVSVLNLSWKGVVSLLQLGKGALAVKVNVADIILTLISLANESLRCAAEQWSFSMKEEISVMESKRIFLPVKFYLINAVRIISHYPSQAFSVYRDITLCIIMISTFRISLSKEELLKSASEALAELLEPTSFHLLNSLLNSAQVKQESKFEILDWLFSDGSDLHLVLGDPENTDGTNAMDAIFSVSCNAMHGARILLLGRVALFLNLLKSSPDLEDDVRLGIARKLGWLLNILIDEDIYSSILVLQIPVLYGSSKTQELAYQSMFSSILHALKTFMIVVSSTLTWGETLSFLLKNILHPHFLCWEIVMELLCFMVRNAEIEMVNDIIDKLFSLLMFLDSSELVFTPGSALQKISRSICTLLTYSSQTVVDQVYNSVIGGNRSKSSSSIYVALLVEGFPLNFLSENIRSIAVRRIVTEYFGFVESFDDESSRVCGSGVFGAPIFALSAALHSIQDSIFDTDMKILKLLAAIIHKYRSSADNLIKDRYCKLLGETLWIISNMKHLFASEEMEGVILELQNLFISGPAASDAGLLRCKPNLSFFMAGFGHIELAEGDDSAKSSAVWELYHMLLRERHWAFVHLAITAFGYFASRTTCNELWRFVPEDAALSFDIESGNEASKESFMSEVKGVLEKEMARTRMARSSDQLGLLAKEGLLLKEMVQKIMNINPEAMMVQKITNINPDAMICDTVEIVDEKQANKRRKLPDGINEGVELLQSGLKVIGDGLSLWQKNHNDSAELHDNFLTHFSHLEDVIAHLVSLAGSG